MHACMHACSDDEDGPAGPPDHQPAATHIHIYMHANETHLFCRIQVRLRLDQQLRHAIGLVSYGNKQRRVSILHTQSRRQSQWW